MDILQIGKGWFPEEPGGLNRYFYDCCQALPTVGVTVHGLVAGSDRPTQESQGQVQTFATAKDSLLNRWLGARRWMAQQAQLPSLVTSHFALYTLPILTQLGDRPLVMHFHGPWALEGQAEGGNAFGTRVKQWLEQTCYRRATVFIVLSYAFRDILHQHYGIPLQQIQVVPGGVHLDTFDTGLSRAQARDKLGWDRDRPTLVVVRRLAKRMGLENLIQAIAEVRPRHPDLKVNIAGKGALKDSLQQQIDDLGLTQQVTLLGYVPDEYLPLIYRAADLSMVPTLSLEGFGLIVVESLAAGTPVLGTPIGGIPEILRPFSPDLVLDGSTPEQLARGIAEALDGTRSLPSDTDCQRYVAENFAWPIIAQRLKTIYAHAQGGMP
jgi:glycosyltransferase involved in cell wall biosynthesis